MLPIGYYNYMTQSASERRMVENEVVFREYNQRVQKKFDEIQRVATEDNQKHLIPTEDPTFQFYCECADENCRQRIPLKLSQYNEIHKKKDRFVIVSGHEVKSIEHVIKKNSDFWIVEKFYTPPDSVSGLHKTPVDNT